jgi:hypothetical protein
MTSAGFPIAKPPIKDLEIGIGRVYAAHANKMLYVFDDLEEYIEEKRTYSREVDELGNPKTEIARKSEYHLMDAERYFVVGHGSFAPVDSKIPKGGKKAKKVIQFSSSMGRMKKWDQRKIPAPLRD